MTMSKKNQKKFRELWKEEGLLSILESSLFMLELDVKMKSELGDKQMAWLLEGIRLDLKLFIKQLLVNQNRRYKALDAKPFNKLTKKDQHQ